MRVPITTFIYTYLHLYTFIYINIYLFIDACNRRIGYIIIVYIVSIGNGKCI